MKNSARSPSGEDEEARGIGGRREGKEDRVDGGVSCEKGGCRGRRTEGDEQTGDANDGGGGGWMEDPELQRDR